MSTRDRDWLRTFLRLDARSALDGIPLREIERQEDTILRALALLDEQPGCVLADEVGMGKTYEAIGVIAACLESNPRARVLILTPGPDLNGKWMGELGRVSDPTVRIYDFKESFDAVRTLDELVTAMARPGNRVVVAPSSMFTGGRAADQADLLTWFCKHLALSGPTRAAIFRRALGGKLEPTDTPIPDELAARLDELFVRGRRPEQPLGLKDLYDEGGLDAFASDEAVRRALDLARFRRIHLAIPDLDLLVVDEAHKLKNEGTVRSTGVHTVFRRKFAKAVFLTATPFQLDVAELKSLFHLFAIAKGAPSDVMAIAESLFDEIRAYQVAYQSFESVWKRVDAAQALELGRLLEADPSLERPVDDPGLRVLTQHARELVRRKEASIEPGFRKWMIRSLREEKRIYRQHKATRLPPSGPGMIPFLVYERLLAELYRHGESTYKAAVEMNLASSYGAAATGALLDKGSARTLPGEAPSYQGLMRSVLTSLREQSDSHPKLGFVLADALEAADRGEKTLVFCARVETLRELRRVLQHEWLTRLQRRWDALLPEGAVSVIAPDADAKKDKRELLQRRFHSPQDALYLGLRERYARTLIAHVVASAHDVDRIVEEANLALGRARVGKTSASRLDYRLAKRAIEHAAACIASHDLANADPLERQALETITNPDFVVAGLDLVAGGVEEDEGGEHAPTWRIGPDLVRLVLEERPSLFRFLANEIDKTSSSRNQWLSFGERVALTERVARWLTRKEVPFLLDLLTAAKEAGLDVENVESRALLDFLDRFWMTAPGRVWLDRLRDFVFFFLSRAEGDRAVILDLVLSTGEFVRETTGTESRERLREAFNAPLFPMVLLANEVMQEGLDLHRSCRRVVHHDLAWNPAQLEQRVGRVDRLGSHVQRLRAQTKTADSTLDVLYPLITRTIDERVYRTVKSREKWLDLMLGAPPSFDEEPGFETVALPEKLVERLRVDLRPRAGEAAESPTI